MGRGRGAGGAVGELLGAGAVAVGAPSDQGTVEALRPAGTRSLWGVRGHVGYSRVLTVALVSLTPWIAVCHSVARHSGLSRAPFGGVGTPLGQAMAGTGRRLAALSGD